MQIAHPASWQIELGRLDAALSISGGLADRELGHWTKTVAPGEEFRTPAAHLTVTPGGVDAAAHRLTAAHERFLDVPEVEEDLPVIFNEYCTTWGSPSPASLRAMAERLAGKGIEYLVIDSGWYKTEGTCWFDGHGDWLVDLRTFPDGLGPALEPVRAAGMIPGIWFEFETLGDKSTAFALVDRHLKRDGVAIQAGTRRLWDHRDPSVVEYLKERVIDFLKANGFGWTLVSAAIAFYRLAVPVLKRGTSHRSGPKVASYRHPKGWQAVRRDSGDGSTSLVVAHRFGTDDSGRITAPLAAEGRYEVTAAYGHREVAAEVIDGVRRVDLDEPFSAVALLLTRVP